MTLRNEIFEGLAAARAARDLVWDPQREYANEMYKVARRENEDAEEVIANRKAAIARRSRGESAFEPGTLPLQPVAASSNMPGTELPALGGTKLPPGGALQPTMPSRMIPRSSGFTPPYMGRYAEGGMVFDPEGEDYDYDTARKAGLSQGDDGHWPSRDPRTGMQLKGRKHPTYNKAIETDRGLGYEEEKGDDGRYYTRKKAFQTGGMTMMEGEEDPLAPLQAHRPQMTIADPDALVTELIGTDRTLESQVPPPSQPTGVAINTQLNVRGAGDRARQRTMESKIPMPTDTPPPGYDPRGDFERRLDESREAEGGRTLMDDVRALVGPRYSMEEIAEMRNRPPGSAMPPPQALDATSRVPFAGDRLPAYERDRVVPPLTLPGSGNTRQPNQTPGQPPVPPKATPGVRGGTNGPITPGNNTPGGATTGANAPPPGAAAANQPTSARKALNDQTRTEAFDPVADRADPGNRQLVDAGGRRWSNEEVHQMFAGAAGTLVPQGSNDGSPPPLGQGTVSQPVYQAYVAKHNAGGKLSSGEALLVGMMSDYRTLLKQGRLQQANVMAASLIQAASIEAAAYARVAQDALRKGDMSGAMTNLVNGLNQVPDGVNISSPDGRTLVATDPRTGQTTGQVAVTPQQLLAAIMGLSDGTAVWNALQGSAAMLAKPDPNAGKRALDMELTRERITGQRLRNRKLAAGGGNGAAGSSGPAAALNALLNSSGAGGGGTTTRRAQGSDDGDGDGDNTDE